MTSRRKITKMSCGRLLCLFASGVVLTGYTAPGVAHEPDLSLAPYVAGHAQQAPQDLLGGPIKVDAVQPAGGLAQLVLPGPRTLDPNVFGSRARPGAHDVLLGDVGKFGMIADDGRYTISDHATPFSNWLFEGQGSVRMTVIDRTANDAASTKDEINFEAEFTLPDGVPYRVVVNKPLAHGMDHPIFGGVGTNMIIHGQTGIGTALMPAEFMYAGFWGTGDIYRDGELINEAHMVHVMVTEITRDETGKLLFSGEMGRDPGKRMLHLMIPPLKPVPGKGMVDDPLKTNFMPFAFVKEAIGKTMKSVEAMADGPEKTHMMVAMTQTQEVMAATKERVTRETQEGTMFGMPFIHINFMDITVTANRL